MRLGPTAIRPAQLDDADEIARLATELGYPTATQELVDRLASLLANPRHHVAVATGGAGHLLGWVHAEHRTSLLSGDRAELLGLVVDASARRAGLGRSLVWVAEEWAAGRGLRTMAVRSNTARAASHPFYEAMGYSQSKSQHVYTKALPATMRPSGPLREDHVPPV